MDHSGVKETQSNLLLENENDLEIGSEGPPPQGMAEAQKL